VGGSGIYEAAVAALTKIWSPREVTDDRRFSLGEEMSKDKMQRTFGFKLKVSLFLHRVVL
jgi:hypothetical protein